MFPSGISQNEQKPFTIPCLGLGFLEEKRKEVKDGQNFLFVFPPNARTKCSRSLVFLETHEGSFRLVFGGVMFLRYTIPLGPHLDHELLKGVDAVKT